MFGETFFGVKFMNVKIDWMFVENNCVSMTGGNCKKFSQEHYVRPSKMVICLMG